jgi:type II secretory ATPase GspE/PulE/Tfp pilus assembly ATPase PilB-like protein/serine/threonine protein kinase
MSDKAYGTRLLLLLTTHSIINSDQASQAMESNPELPEQYLLDQGLCDRSQLAEVAAKSFGAESVQGEPTYLEGVISEELQRKHNLFPVDNTEGLVLAASSPGNTQCTNDLTAVTGKMIQYKIVDRVTLKEHFDRLKSNAAIEDSTSENGRPEMTMAVSTPQLRPAELLIGGRYRRSKKLLEGRFSTLYAGRDEQSGLNVAIRHLESFAQFDHVLSGPSEEARQQTLREGRVLSRLCHPALPRIRDLVQNEEDIYLVGDAIKGRSLKESIEEDGALDPELVRRYMIQLLRVVDYLHTQEPPIIHRDLRGETVLACTHGNLCLAEFGLAKMGEKDGEDGTTSFRSAGHPQFAAPEQLMGDASSPKNDLYSVGALAYFMACGKPPSESLKRFAGASLMDPLPAELDDRVRETIDRCLAPRPEERAESASQLLSVLDVREARMPMLVSTPARSAPVNESDIESGPEAETAKLPPPPPAPAKRSMWQLLFGIKGEAVDLGPIVQESSEVREEQLANFPFADLASMDLNREVCRVLPEGLCRNICGICIGSLSDTEVTIACKDPTDVHIYDQVAIATKGDLTPTLMRADAALIEHAIEFVYRGDALGPETRWSKFLDLKRLHDVTIETVNEQAVVTFGDKALEGPIVEAVDQLVKEAIAADASDIHLEPFDVGMDIRYRIDGVLRKVAFHDRQEASAIVKRLKVMANMDIAQERITQGGRISLKVGDQEFDLRVSIVPVPVGESVVMRILKKGAFTLTLTDLGFSEEKETKYRRILSQPHGMILVCGPTGSGKSTTLYASLKEIQRPDRKLLTAEDPIEYQMPGIIQVQMNTAPKEQEKKVTFSKTLREFLRQDPDVILVGEIRDQETAEIGIQAALTGHLLLSTLHTNDSVGIIARLRDMGCEPFQIGSVLLGGLAQRLARRICQNCRQQIPVPDEMLELFTEHGISKPKMYKGRGCRKCHQSGHRGRVGLYELLEVTPEIRAHVNRGDHEEEIRKTAESQGFKDLLTDGLDKVVRGFVSLDEVLRVCKTV